MMEQIFECKESDLKVGINFLDDRKIVAFLNQDGSILAMRNRCKHQGGSFVSLASEGRSCVLRCPLHGWELDASTLQYTNPSGNLKQEPLIVKKQDRTFVFFQNNSVSPWGNGTGEAGPLSKGEFSIKFYAHACASITVGKTTIFTDPWLCGPAFTRGWWLKDNPPSDWLEALASAAAIYISHNHSDHLNAHTLKKLAEVNPNVPIYVPAFESRSCERLLSRIGLKDVRTTSFNIWHSVGELKMMILRDATGRDDSGLLVEHKGYRVLNAVDRGNLNNGVLPRVDILMSAFASGATGYPVCWSDLYSRDRIFEITQRNRNAVIQSVVQTCKLTQPKVWVPFAGYFSESHPADSEIRSINLKNSPADVYAAIRRQNLETQVWYPKPSEIFDVATLSVTESSDLPNEDFSFEPYLDEIESSMNFEPLKSMSGILHYFDWAAFRMDNFILHIIETDEGFENNLREFMIDFSDLTIIQRRPSSPHHYERMRVRADVFRHVLRYGEPWEEISIGFQARFYREPDVYVFDFWSHFQNHLPDMPPSY